MKELAFRQLVGNKVFTATFTKKDGTERTMNGRLDVAKYTKGGSNNQEHCNHLITVFEMNKKQYRTLNLNTLRQIKCGGEVIDISKKGE